MLTAVLLAIVSCSQPRGKSLFKIAYVIFVILKLHDLFCDFFVILVISSDFFV